jgi:hypothetical protein
LKVEKQCSSNTLDSRESNRVPKFAPNLQENL